MLNSNTNVVVHTYNKSQNFKLPLKILSLNTNFWVQVQHGEFQQKISISKYIEILSAHKNF